MNSSLVHTALFVTSSFVVGSALQYAYKTFFPSMLDTSNEEELIRKYLLNHSVLYSHNKPKLWIYIDTLPNARDWASTTFRNNRKINKGYIYACISRVIHHCSDDFHICLIDNSAFEHFIPGFPSAMVPEKYKKQYGMALLLYFYGGLVIPPSFICMKSLRPLYNMILKENKAFFGERENRRLDANPIQPSISASMFVMGAPRYNSSMKIISELMKSSSRHVDPDVWCVREIQSGNALVIDGKWIGTVDATDGIVTTDRLVHTAPILFDSLCAGVAFWDEDLERKHKYQKWLDMSEADIEKDESNLGQLMRITDLNKGRAVL